MTVSSDTRDRVRKLGQPIALFLGRLGFSPNALTVIGFAITGLGALILTQQAWLLGGLVVFGGGAFDLFDGSLARATGRVSRFGSFIDSVFDRWGEAVVYIGLIAGLQASGWPDVPVIAAAAMGAAFMVSYTRAKSEGLGFSAGTRMARIGLMPREVRLVVLCVGLVLAGLLGTTVVVPAGASGAGGAALPPGILALEVTLGVIAVGATITSIQRIIHVRQQAVAGDGK